MKISDFVANISGGLARSNRFNVLFIPPPSVDVAGLMPNQQLLMLCDQIQIPGLNINTTPTRTYGEVREAPYEYNYEPINIQFYVDTKMDVKAFWDRWIKSIQNDNRRSFRYYNEYICKNMDIYVQDLLDQNRYLVRLYEVYPKSVGQIQLDYAAKDVMKIQVSLVFKYWLSVNAQTDTGAKNSNITAGPVQTNDLVVPTKPLEIPQPPVMQEPVRLPPQFLGPTNTERLGIQGRMNELGVSLTPFP